MERLATGDCAAGLDEVVNAAHRDQEWEVIPQGRVDSDGRSEPAGEPAEGDGPGLAEQPTLPEPGHLGPGVFDGAGLEQPTVPEPGRPRSAPGAVTEASPPPFLQDRGPAQVSS